MQKQHKHLIPNTALHYRYFVAKVGEGGGAPHINTERLLNGKKAKMPMKIRDRGSSRPPKGKRKKGKNANLKLL